MIVVFIMSRKSDNRPSTLFKLVTGSRPAPFKPGAKMLQFQNAQGKSFEVRTLSVECDFIHTVP